MYQLSVIFLFLISCNTTTAPTSTKPSDDPQNESTPTEVLDMWINHFQSPCTGSGDAVLCLQAQFGETIKEENWEYFYDAIEGFDDYELGNIYHLKVSKKDVENPVADGSSFTYHMEQLVSKKPISEDTTFTLFLKQEGVPAYISKNEEVDNYVLANELVVVTDSEATAMALDKKLAEETPFNGVFKHTNDRDAIVLIGLE
ncbi:MAG: DUF4377 domain-containing protein [Chitinophagales bacterium]